jgi:hypothetical protein
MSPNVSKLSRSSAFRTCLWLILLTVLSCAPVYIYLKYPAVAESSSFGLWTKVLAAIAAAGFGMLGVGKDTRKSGTLTQTGWIALIGIVVAGEFALAATFNDYTSGKKKDELLLLSVQRAAYRLHGLTLWMEVPLDNSFYGLDPYKDTLRKAYPLIADQAGKRPRGQSVDILEGGVCIP